MDILALPKVPYPYSCGETADRIFGFDKSQNKTTFTFHISPKRGDDMSQVCFKKSIKFLVSEREMVYVGILGKDYYGDFDYCTKSSHYNHAFVVKEGWIYDSYIRQRPLERRKFDWEVFISWLETFIEEKGKKELWETFFNCSLDVAEQQPHLIRLIVSY